MKLLIVCLVVFISVSSCKKDNTSDPHPAPVSDSFSVTVNNGYGSGTYKKGDTVHIWSKELSDAQVFDAWTGDFALLNNNDWHAWFIMPQRNVTFTGNIKNSAAFSLNYELIRGRDRMKPVYSNFPALHKGLLFLLHGSGGSAQQFVSSFEAQQVIKELVTDGFAVIITEAEEATTGIDADGDGKIRWLTFPVDTLTNIDLVNIRAITDTFYNRGLTNRNLPRYSLGMSNGGAYSSILSYAYHYKAGISYCAQSGTPLASVSTTPFQFCMQRFDNNENVGPQGNAAALSNSQTFNARGICSKYLINEHAPLYPQRFARRSDISLTTSAAIFNEIKSHGFLVEKNYFKGYSSLLVTAIQNNPLQFPVILSLSLSQKGFLLEQLDCSIADHQFYSDFTKASLHFLNSQCL